MKIFTRTILLMCLSILFTDCATIVSKAVYPITINTIPSNAKVVIKDEIGNIIFYGNSPTTVYLDASAGFFRKASYFVTVSSEGYEEQLSPIPIRIGIDGWYFANILFTGAIGLLIVDPASGAMYKLLDDYMNIILIKSTTSIDRRGLKVYDLANIPDEWRDKLVRMNP